MTELIVALDGPEPLFYANKVLGGGVRCIKLGPQALFDP